MGQHLSKETLIKIVLDYRQNEPTLYSFFGVGDLMYDV